VSDIGDAEWGVMRASMEAAMEEARLAKLEASMLLKS